MKTGQKLKLVVNPRYAAKSDIVRNLVERRLKSEPLHANNRNTVSLTEIDGERYVIKRFHPRSCFHQLIYAGLRKSKAFRAYDNALRLIGKGVQTAFPIAYAEIRRNGLLKEAVFISTYVEGGLIVDIYNPAVPKSVREALCRGAGQFTRRMHDLGFIPLDYNPGNLFYIRRQGADDYDFSIIDINRMDFIDNPPMKIRMRALSQLGLGPDEYLPALQGYLGLPATVGYGDSRIQAGIAAIEGERRRAHRFKDIKHALGRAIGLRR